MLKIDKTMGWAQNTFSQDITPAALSPLLCSELLKIKTKQKEVTGPIPTRNLSRCLEPMWGFEPQT